MKISQSFASSSFLAVVLVMLNAGAPLSAAPKPKAGEGATAATTLVAMASIPQLPSIGNPPCPDNLTCEGIGALAREMVELVDADRLNPANNPETGGSAHPLKWDPRLAQAALEHSKDMALHHYFSHYAPNGDSPVERVTRLGVQWRSIGENIAKNFTVERAEDAFMNEPRFQPNHRGNILNPKFNSIGVGIVRGQDGMVYVTQEFAQE